VSGIGNPVFFYNPFSVAPQLKLLNETEGRFEVTKANNDIPLKSDPEFREESKD